ncbi:hypothetical protein DMH15_15475 [Streptomyces sp. WAC 06725]|uniref:hypothetical protein n=1 Tax=Streptomyces sp. WAC 06725 TaxID=2203209 RepID=UPI000F74AC3C|nr:hypothetical protein [Streptomyces sp. WAC 06725]RSO40254.1 hypothetical protein DMH15_15475 [Streptomyces sp. WAC 06725]
MHLVRLAGQDLDYGPGPEGAFVLEPQVAAFSGVRVLGPNLAGCSVGNHGTYELLTGSGEHLAGTCMLSGFQYRRGVLAALVARANEDRQDWQALASASVHPRRAPPLCLAVLQLVSPHRAGGHPRAPAAGDGLVLGADSLLPLPDDVLGEAEAVGVGVVAFDVLPEAASA